MKKIYLTISLIFCALLLANFAYADAAPPFAVIHLDSGGENIPNETLYVEALSCEDENFTSPESYYSENPPPNFNTSIYDEEKNCYWKRYSEAGYCKDDVCPIYRGFPYGKNFRIAIHVMSLNKTFITKEQEAGDVTVGMNRYYISLAGSLEQDGISIIQDVKLENSYTNKSNIFGYFIAALVTTIIIELLVAWIYFSITKIKKKALFSVIYANLISVPIAWILVLFIRFMPTAIFSIVTIAEIFAVVFEAYFIHWLNKKQIKLKQAFILSLVMNIASFILGASILISIILLVG